MPDWMATTKTNPAQSLVSTRKGVRHYRSAAALLQVAEYAGPRPLHEALRRRRVTGDELREAAELLGPRTGRGIRRELARGCADGPWSGPEADLHHLLRAAGITGWRANEAVFAQGRMYVVDVAFRSLRLAIEVDSFEYHGSRQSFEDDRARHNDLTASGWVVLHITPRQLSSAREWVVRWIQRAIARCEGDRLAVVRADDAPADL